MIDFIAVNNVTKQQADKLLQLGGEFIQMVEINEKKIIHVACETWRAMLQKQGINIHNSQFTNVIKTKFKRHNEVQVIKIRFKGSGKDYNTNAFVFSNVDGLPTTVEELCSLLELEAGSDSAPKVSICMCICLNSCQYLYLFKSFRTITILTEKL